MYGITDVTTRCPKDLHVNSLIKLKASDKLQQEGNLRADATRNAGLEDIPSGAIKLCLHPGEVPGVKRAGYWDWCTNGYLSERAPIRARLGAAAYAVIC